MNTSHRAPPAHGVGTRLGARGRRVLDRWLVQRAALTAPLAGLGLASPALAANFGLDGELLRAGARDESLLAPLRAFILCSGSPYDVYAMKDAGALAWLGVEDQRVAFFRPLAALTHALDERLWASSPFPAHAHSLLWLFAALLAVGALFRRLLPPPVAALGIWLYALDDARGHAAGWIANRNALMAAAFGAAALVAHHRWRVEGWRPGSWLAPLALGASLSSAELGAGAIGFFAAHAALVERGPVRRRVVGAVPWFAVVAAWAIVYRALGYGARGSAVYVDPVSEPWTFLLGAMWKVPVLLGSALGAVPVTVWGAVPPQLRPLAAAGVLGAVAVLLAVLAIRASRSAELGFLGAGGLFALVPACAALPDDRLLFFVGLGSAPLMAHLFLGMARGAAPPLRRWATRAACAPLIVGHAVLSPIALPVAARGTDALEGIIDGAGALVEATPPRSGDVLLAITAPTYFTGNVALRAWAETAAPAPAIRRVLHAGPGPIVVARIDERTLRVVSPLGFGPGERPLERPVRAGWGLYLPKTLALVREVTPAGLPLTVDFVLAHPIDAPENRWFAWIEGRFREVKPPAPGEVLSLPGL